MLTRRSFLLSTAAASTLACSTSPEPAETPAVAPTTEDIWGGPVIDSHTYFRGRPDSNAVHLGGCRVSPAVLLTGVSDTSILQQDSATAAVDVTLPDAADQLRSAGEQGAIAFGEFKKDVMADGAELQRCHARAAEARN